MRGHRQHNENRWVYIVFDVDVPRVDPMAWETTALWNGNYFYGQPNKFMYEMIPYIICDVCENQHKMSQKDFLLRLVYEHEGAASKQQPWALHNNEQRTMNVTGTRWIYMQYIHIYAHTYTPTHIWEHIHTRTYTYTYAHKYAHIYTHTHTYAHTYTHKTCAH